MMGCGQCGQPQKACLPTLPTAPTTTGRPCFRLTKTHSPDGGDEVGTFSTKWVLFQLSRFRLNDSGGYFFDCQMGTFSLDKNSYPASLHSGRCSALSGWVFGILQGNVLKGDARRHDGHRPRLWQPRVELPPDVGRGRVVRVEHPTKPRRAIRFCYHAPQL